MNIEHSAGASDPKINTIRFIENALRETQRLKAALSKDPKNFSTMDKKTYDGNKYQAQWCLGSQNQYHQG